MLTGQGDCGRTDEVKYRQRLRRTVNIMYIRMSDLMTPIYFPFFLTTASITFLASPFLIVLTLGRQTSHKLDDLVGVRHTSRLWILTLRILKCEAANRGFALTRITS